MSRATKISVLAIVFVAGLAAGVGAYIFQQRPLGPFTETDITGVPWARDFDLSGHNAKRRHMADFRGKVVLMFFGYTNCPDTCPTALAEIAQVVTQLGPEANDVQVLFITTDPARDTQERLKSYVTAFHPAFLGLRGTQEQTLAAAKEFKIYFEAQKLAAEAHAAHTHDNSADYMVNHSTGILVFDVEGRPRVYAAANGHSVNGIVHDVKLLLHS